MEFRPVEEAPSVKSIDNMTIIWVACPRSQLRRGARRARTGERNRILSHEASGAPRELADDVLRSIKYQCLDCTYPTNPWTHYCLQ